MLYSNTHERREKEETPSPSSPFPSFDFAFPHHFAPQTNGRSLKFRFPISLRLSFDESVSEFVLRMQMATRAGIGRGAEEKVMSSSAVLFPFAFQPKTPSHTALSFYVPRAPFRQTSSAFGGRKTTRFGGAAGAGKGGKAELSEEQLEEMKEAFALFDTENHGSIDVRELKVCVPYLSLREVSLLIVSFGVTLKLLLTAFSFTTKPQLLPPVWYCFS